MCSGALGEVLTMTTFYDLRYPCIRIFRYLEFIWNRGSPRGSKISDQVIYLRVVGGSKYPTISIYLRLLVGHLVGHLWAVEKKSCTCPTLFVVGENNNCLSNTPGNCCFRRRQKELDVCNSFFRRPTSDPPNDPPKISDKLKWSDILWGPKGHPMVSDHSDIQSISCPVIVGHKMGAWAYLPHPLDTLINVE